MICKVHIKVKLVPMCPASSAHWVLALANLRPIRDRSYALKSLAPSSVHTIIRLTELFLEPSGEGVVPFASSAWPGAGAAGRCWLYANWFDRGRRRLSFVSNAGKALRVKRSVNFLLTLCLASSSAAVFARREFASYTG
eukprot:4565537-Pyramimonas_sp.AAC.1